MQCEGSAEQVNTTKQKIDKILREAGKSAGDASAMGLECHIVGSIPVTKSILFFLLIFRNPKRK